MRHSCLDRVDVAIGCRGSGINWIIRQLTPYGGASGAAPYDVSRKHREQLWNGSEHHGNIERWWTCTDFGHSSTTNTIQKPYNIIKTDSGIDLFGYLKHTKNVCYRILKQYKDILVPYFCLVEYFYLLSSAPITILKSGLQRCRKTLFHLSFLPLLSSDNLFGFIHSIMKTAPNFLGICSGSESKIRYFLETWGHYFLIC